MALFDFLKERRRLANLYGDMVDGELEKLVAQAHSLSDAAKDALKAELSRRGLRIVLQESPPPKDEAPGPIVLRRFRDLPDALLAKTILNSADIECFLIDENTIRMDWLWSNLLGGVKIWVRPPDADAAELLDQDYLETFVVGGVGEYKQPRCPNCRSFVVSFRELIKRLAYGTILLTWLAGFGVLIPLHRRAWKCQSCGHEWEGSEDPPDATP